MYRVTVKNTDDNTSETTEHDDTADAKVEIMAQLGSTARLMQPTNRPPNIPYCANAACTITAHSDQLLEIWGVAVETPPPAKSGEKPAPSDSSQTGTFPNGAPRFGDDDTFGNSSYSDEQEIAMRHAHAAKLAAETDPAPASDGGDGGADDSGDDGEDDGSGALPPLTDEADPAPASGDGGDGGADDSGEDDGSSALPPLTDKADAASDGDVGEEDSDDGSEPLTMEMVEAASNKTKRAELADAYAIEYPRDATSNEILSALLRRVSADISKE